MPTSTRKPPTPAPTNHPTADDAGISTASFSLLMMAGLGGFLVLVGIGLMAYYWDRMRKKQHNRVGALPRRRGSSFADWIRRGSRSGRQGGDTMGAGPKKANTRRRSKDMANSDRDEAYALTPTVVENPTTTMAVWSSNGYNEQTARTFAIETSMKSSAFGFLLACLHFESFLVRVPAAVSVVWMALTGSILAVAFRAMPVKE